MQVLSKIFLLFLLLGLSISQASADVFVIKAIHVEGLQGMSPETVINALPVQVGDKFDTANSGAVVRALYSTGLFNNISIGRRGDALIVTVGSRPVIGSLHVEGNRTIPKKKLDEILTQQGLVEGNIFSSDVLANLQHSLQDEYEQIGKYNARVTSSVMPIGRNRVAVKLQISEGRTLKVKQINIIGNHAFSQSTLVRQMKLTPPRLWSFFTHGDLYTQKKLSDSLKALSDYYMNRGYLKFRIDSVQATLTPDHNYVYVIVHITEGPIYTFSGANVVGNLVLQQTKVNKVLHKMLKPGSVFSQGKVKFLTKAFKAGLGDMGYLNAVVHAVPDENDCTNQVFITFYIDQGTRIYVRRIVIKGDPKTEDMVARRVLPQMESSLASITCIKAGKLRLKQLGYFKDVHETTVPVPGLPDQVDLDYNVTEAASAQAMAQAGYGTDGLVLSAGINQSNFLGTGNSVGVNFSRSQFTSIYSLSYNNPYYTQDGIQRGFNIYAQRVTPGSVNITSYTTNMYGGTINYTFPMDATGDSLQLGYGYQYTSLSIGSYPSIQLAQFALDNGLRFSQLLLNGGWSHNTLDRAIFPTQGNMQTLAAQVSAPAGNRQLDYYKLSYNMSYYHPLISDDLIFAARAGLGYGNGYGRTNGLPFFVNYFAGGIGYAGQVRGYSANTLGPVDSNLLPLGGNELVSGSAAIIFPNFISKDRLRTSLFVDAGNVYTSQPVLLGGQAAGPLRYSVGVDVQWRVPMLNVLVEVSLAHAINPQNAIPGIRPGDRVSPFQFNFGTNF